MTITTNGFTSQLNISFTIKENKMARFEPRIISEKEQDVSFTPFVEMEDLLDKLKLLSYESEFLSALKIKPLHKYYFVVTKNPGEQFYLFSLLAAWLVRKTGKQFEPPQEYDDPNDTITKILNAVKQSDLNLDFPPNKLKQGVGEHVVKILNHLANEALNKSGFTFQKPKPPEEKEDEVEVIEDESEINLEKVEEEMVAAYTDDSDDENLFNLDDLKLKKQIQPVDLTLNNPDEEAWKLEVERVLPKLKVTIKNENRDWRNHLEQMKQLKVNIDEYYGSTKGQLEKIHKDIGQVLDKIDGREKYLNRELEAILDEYRMLQEQLSKVKDKYNSVSTGVAERTREFNKLTDKLETVKQQMEERGSSMTDGTPLVNIKKSVSKIKSEIVDMDVRIGVLECLLLQTKVRDEKMLENEFGQSISIY